MPKAQVQTPGLPASPPAQSGDDRDDLAQFESDGLPPRPEGMEAVQMQLAEERAARRRLERKVEQMSSDKADKPGKKAEPVVSMDEAVRMAEEAVANGMRPRATLTPEGWYCHPEIARVAASGRGVVV